MVVEPVQDLQWSGSERVVVTLEDLDGTFGRDVVAKLDHRRAKVLEPCFVEDLQIRSKQLKEGAVVVI